MGKYIDAGKLLVYLNDLALTAAPNEWDTQEKRIAGKTRYDTLQDVMEIIEERATADAGQAGEWISVKKRLPEHEGSYLVCTGKSKAFMAHYWPHDKRFSRFPELITHWRPRPETPKTDGGVDDEERK